MPKRRHDPSSRHRHRLFVEPLESRELLSVASPLPCNPPPQGGEQADHRPMPADTRAGTARGVQEVQLVLVVPRTGIGSGAAPAVSAHSPAPTRAVVPTSEPRGSLLRAGTGGEVAQEVAAEIPEPAGQGVSLVSAVDVAFLEMTASSPHESAQGLGPDRPALALPVRGGPAGADRTLLTPLSPGPGGPTAPRADGTSGGSETAPAKEGPEAVVPPRQEDPPDPAFLPRAAGVIADGIRAGFTALEEALKSLTEPEGLPAGPAGVLMHWVGVSLWGLAAVLTAAVARQRQRRETGLIAGLERSGSYEEEQP